MLREMYHICLTVCGRPDQISDYEEKLLEKCFDKKYEQQINFVSTQYEPPFLSNIIP